MDTGSPRRKGWGLTQEAFDRLLSHLDPDRERAGEKYEQLRLKLVKFFEWRGAPFPEEHADEALNRVTKRVAEGEAVRDFHSYSLGAARLVFLETLKEPDSHRTSLDSLPPLPAPPPESDDSRLRLECFEKCLRALPAESCELITQYYQEEKRAKIDHRKALAAQLGIPLNALRIRAHRIREKLEACLDDCLRQG